MEAPIKKPKTKPRKQRKPRKPRTTGGTNITINVGTTTARKPRAKPKPRATQNTFPFRSPSAGGGGGGGVLPTAFPGQGDQFRQVIYTPQADVGGSIKALEKSIENLSRSGDSRGDNESAAQRSRADQARDRLFMGGFGGGGGGGGGKTGTNRAPDREATAQAAADARRYAADILREEDPTRAAIANLQSTPIGQQPGNIGTPSGSTTAF